MFYNVYVPEIWQKRLSYIDEIEDQEELIMLARYACNRYAQIKAIPKVKDSEVIEELALTAVDWEVRFQALLYTHNQSVFIDRALNDRRSEVRELAASRIKDEECLIRIAMNDKDREVCLTASRGVRTYSNQIYLLNNCRHSNVCRDIAECIYDPVLLEDLAINHYSHKVRRMACDRISNQDVLKKVVCFEKYYDIKKIASEKISDPDAFRYIADNAKNPHIAHAAILQVNDEDFLVECILNDRIFLEIFYSVVFARIRDKSNIKRVLCQSDSFWLCRYFIRQIEDEDLLKSVLECDIDERLVLEIEKRMETLKMEVDQK